MKDQSKTKKQLINELVDLRRKMAAKEALETERNRAEGVLQQLAAIVQSSDDAIICKTLEGIILSWNSGAERIYGYSSSEIVGQRISILLPMNHPDEVSQFLERISRGERIDHYETVHMRKDGLIIDVFLTISPVKDATGKIVGASTIARDITDRKRVEEALRENEERYRNLFEGSTDPIYITTLRGEILDVNPSMLDLFGYSREEMIGLNTKKTYVHIEDRLRFLKEIEREGFAKNYELKLRRKDGAEMECLVTSCGRRAADGKIVGYHGIIHDITERKRIEQALRESEERYRTAIEYSNDGMAMVQGDLHVFVNQKFVEMFGYDKSEEILGKPLSMFVHPDDLKRIEEFRKLASSKYECRVIRKDGKQVDVEVSLTKTVYRGETVSLAYFRDITERKRTEEEREKLIHQLQEALGNIRTLRGLLPICASCKKVRDDKGYWNQIESFVRDHSEAEFSHSICPECMKKLYPDFDESEESC